MPPIIQSRLRRRAALALAPLLVSGGMASALDWPPAPADTVQPPAGLLESARVEPAVEALVNEAAAACRQRLAERFRSDTAEVDLWLAPAQLIAIESGEQGLASLNREGLSFGWMLPRQPAPAPIGLCRTDGRGMVQAIEQQPD